MSPRTADVNCQSDTPDSVTPWNGMYSSTKSAFHTMSDALSMECSYLDKNIKVMLIAPGTVRSNIAHNAAGYELFPDSLFRQFTQIIGKRNRSTLESNAVTAEEFSRKVVPGILDANPPEYMTFGGFATAFAIVQSLPRFMVRWMARKIWNRPNRP